MADTRKKKLGIDLLLIVLITFIAATLYYVVTDILFPGIEKDTSVNILYRVLITGILGQFGLAGMGSCIVCLIRKDRFVNHGLVKKNMLPAMTLGLVCCIPELVFYLSKEEVYGWFPFIGMKYTYEVLHTSFPINIICYLIIALFWGFFEGFNYVIMADKINGLLPSKYKYWDWGAAILSVFCIIIHGMVGVTPESIVEMSCTIVLIYGMLLVRKLTGNAWGCVVVFFVYWNAINKFYPVLFS